MCDFGIDMMPDKNLFPRRYCPAGGAGFILGLITLALINAVSASAEDTTPPMSVAIPVDSLRLERVVSETIRNNNHLAAARYMEAAVRAKAASAGAWDDPMLMIGVRNLPTSFDFTMDPMTMTMLGISQTIPYGGQKGLSSKAARAEAEAATEERRGMEVDLATAAKTAFYDLYLKQRTVEELNRQKALLEEVATAAESRLRAGLGGQDEILSAQADVWRLESSIQAIWAELEAARYSLNELRGVAVADSIPPLAAPEIDAVPASPEAWLALAHEQYPPLRQWRRQAEGFALSSAAARRMRWPMLTLSADYGIRRSTAMERRANMVGFPAAFPLPLFSGKQQGQMARSMTAMQMNAEAELSQTERTVETALRTLHQQARQLQDNLRLYREQISPASEEAYRSALAGYANGRLTLATLLGYAGIVYRDRLTAIQMSYDLAKTLAEVERYTTDPARWETNPPGTGLQTKGQ